MSARRFTAWAMEVIKYNLSEARNDGTPTRERRNVERQKDELLTGREGQVSALVEWAESEKNGPEMGDSLTEKGKATS